MFFSKSKDFPVLGLIGVLLGVCLPSGALYAGIGESVGFGSRAAALGGAAVSSGQGGFASYYNPASLSLEKEKRLSISYGWVYSQPDFKPITNVVVQNSYVADNAPGAPTYGDVDTSYKSTLGQQIGLSYRLFPDFWNLSLGLTTFMPAQQLAFMDTGEAFIPEYVLYRANTQRPEFHLGVGAEPGMGFRIGAGVTLGFALTSKATAFLNTKTDTVSTLRFTSSAKPKAAPYFGVLFAPENDPKSFSLGTVFRLPLVADNTMQLGSSARAFGNLAAVDFDLQGTGALYYDPMALELGGSVQLLEFMKFYGQLDYQFWQNFQPPAIQVTETQGTDSDTGTLRISPGDVPAFQYVNIIVPRSGLEMELNDQTTFRLGYAYRPSFMKDVPKGAGNYLDPSKHLLNLGVGFKFDRFLSFNQPWTLDFNLGYQYLLTQTIHKTSGNEAGVMNDYKIGYSPTGYEAGGSVWSGGASLSLQL